jgi:hypothetical protein
MAVEEIIQREAPEIEAYKLGLMQQAKGLTSAPPTGGLPAIQAAGTTGLQQRAQNLASSGIGAYQPQLTAAQAAFSSGIGTLSGSQGMYDPNMATGFMNPYQQAVADEINRAYDIQQNQAAGQAVGAGAFGGSRAQIAQQEINRNRASALAKAQADNFLQAQQAAQQAFESQQGRALQGAQQLGQFGVQQAALGELGSNLARQDVNLLSQLGEQQRGIDQAQLEAQRQTQMQQIFEPYQRLGFYSDILRGAPTTQQTLTTSATANPSLLNQIVGGAATGLGLYGAANKTGLI